MMKIRGIPTKFLSGEADPLNINPKEENEVNK
jgi:hypothetical protein